jgi:hypothetical protein
LPWVVGTDAAARMAAGGERPAGAADGPEALTDIEAEELEEHLRGLGYLE